MLGGAQTPWHWTQGWQVTCLLTCRSTKSCRKPAQPKLPASQSVPLLRPKAELGAESFIWRCSGLSQLQALRLNAPQAHAFACLLHLL